MTLQNIVFINDCLEAKKIKSSNNTFKKLWYKTNVMVQ